MASRVAFAVGRRSCPAVRFVFRVPWWWPLPGRRGWRAFVRARRAVAFVRVWGVPVFGALAFVALLALFLFALLS